MSTDVQIFTNQEFNKEIRAIEINNEPWFVGKDVAEALGYVRPRDALKDHVPDKYKKVLTPQQMASVSKGVDSPLCDSPRGLTFINEAGLYKLVMCSKLPNAEKFSDWCCEEVLPQLRKTGMYGRPLTRLEAYKELVKMEEERLALEQKCLEEKARADEYQSTHELYEAVTKKGGWISAKTVTDVLNILGLGRTNFYRFLREQGVVTGKNQPMRCHIETGLMKARYDDYLKQYCVEFSFKGLKYIYAKLVQANKVPSDLTLETWIKYCADLETNHGDSEE